MIDRIKRLFQIDEHSTGEQPLMEIVNTSILEGTFPKKLKLAKVVPVFKSGEDTDPNNYRPISLLSTFNRIFERLMYKRLKSFFEINGLFYESQYGFREKHSTQYALIDIVNRIQNNMDKGLTNKTFSNFQNANRARINSMRLVRR